VAAGTGSPAVGQPADDDAGSVRDDSTDDADWERTEDPGVVAALNEEAYGLSEGEFAQALEALAERRAHLYVARERGQPASCLAALDAPATAGSTRSPPGRARAAEGSRRR
jgi:hypothetical protein